VGDVALDIIERITGRRFDREGKAPDARAALLDVMRWGSRVGMGQGFTRVLGTKKETEGAERDKIVRFLGEALRDPAPEVKRSAALALAARGDARGVDHLLLDLAAPRDPQGTSTYALGQTLEVLLAEPSPKVVSAIAREIRRGNDPIVAALDDALSRLCPAEETGPLRCKLGPAEQALLLDALADRMASKAEVFEGGIGSGLRRPRDRAARAFAALRKLPSEDFWSSGAFAADRAILKMLNDYRASKKMPLLAAPELELPPQPASPGPDDHRTVRRAHEESEGAEARALGAAWLAPFQGKPLDADAIAAGLADLAAKNASIGWKLRIVRLPGARGIVLFLRGYALKPDPSRMNNYGFECEGSDACDGGRLTGGGKLKDAAAGYAKGIREAWEARPKGGEEQTLTIMAQR
jgi:hypothetical protein